MRNRLVVERNTSVILRAHESVGMMRPLTEHELGTACDVADLSIDDAHIIKKIRARRIRRNPRHRIMT